MAKSKIQHECLDDVEVSIKGVTLSLVLLALVVGLVPELSDGWELSRAGVSDGKWWLVFSGHLAHYGLSHLLWDVAVLLPLGVFCELRCRRRMIVATGLAVIAISGWFLAFESQLESYRGLSGVDSALYGLGVVELWLLGKRGSRVIAWIWRGVSGESGF